MASNPIAATNNAKTADNNKVLPPLPTAEELYKDFYANSIDSASLKNEDMLFNNYIRELKHPGIKLTNAETLKRNTAINELEKAVRTIRTEERKKVFEKFRKIITDLWKSMSLPEKKMTAIIFGEAGHDIGRSMEPGEEMLRIGYNVRYRMLYPGKNISGTNGDIDYVISFPGSFISYGGNEYKLIMDPDFPKKFPDDVPGLRSAIAAIKAAKITYNALKVRPEDVGYFLFNRDPRKSPYSICGTGDSVKIGKTVFWKADVNCLNEPHWKK